MSEDPQDAQDAQSPEDSEHSEDSVWFRSQPDESGQYHLLLEFGPDDVEPLSTEDAFTWAREVLQAVATAEHDAAVLAQMTSLGLPIEAAGDMVNSNRADRGEHIPMTALNMALIPGVSARTLKGFLQITRHGKTLGQWEIEDAQQHALGILMAVSNLDLDSAYFRTLVTRFDVGRDVAMTMVGDLFNHRG